MKDSQFTGEWFESLLQGIKTTHPTGDSRRTSPRIGVTLNLDIFPLDPPDARKITSVRLRDVSRTGISLISPIRLFSNTQFCLSFPRMEQLPLRVAYQTVHARMINEHVFQIGARLLWIGAPAVQEELPTPAESEEILRIRQAMLR
jgi:hypothetical protein